VRVADSPNGPWRRPKIDSSDSFDLFAGKTMFDGNRRILVSWLPRRKCDCAERTWGGSMLFPREWYLLSDGTPATRCAPEVVAAYRTDPTASEGARVFMPTRSHWAIDLENMKTSPTAGQSSLATWKGAPADYYLSTHIKFAPGCSVVFYLRGQNGEYRTALDNTYALHLDPVQHRVTLHKQYQWNQRPALVDMPYDFDASKPTFVEIFLDKDILEVFVDHRRSLVSRLLEHPQGSLSVLVRDAPATFEQMRIRTVAPNAAK
jgi:beta-fructofuranosidase